MNRAKVAELLGQIEDLASGGVHDIERGMPDEDIEELAADIQSEMNRLVQEVRA
jgi:hypothetical protein